MCKSDAQKIEYDLDDITFEEYSPTLALKELEKKLAEEQSRDDTESKS